MTPPESDKKARFPNKWKGYYAHYAAALGAEDLLIKVSGAWCVRKRVEASARAYLGGGVDVRCMQQAWQFSPPQSAMRRTTKLALAFTSTSASTFGIAAVR